MSVSVTCRVELQLPDAGFFDTSFFDPSFFDIGTAWHNVITEGDVRNTVPVVVEYGIRGNSPNDRVASTGSVTFALDNSQYNSAALMGYYSLLNSNKRSGFDLNIPVRVSFSTSSLSYSGATLQAFPIGYWRFDETVGTTAADLGSGNHSGTYTGGFTLGAASAVIDGTAVTLNGTTGYVTMGNQSAYNFSSGAMSVECWFKTSTALTKALVGKSDALDPTVGWALYVTGGEVWFTGRNSGSASFGLESGGFYTDGDFHHVVCTWDGTTTFHGVKMYIDGTLVTQGTALGTGLDVTTKALVIGAADNGTSNFISGTIDEVALYNTELSSTQVATKYAARLFASGYYKFFGSLDTAVPIPGMWKERLTHCTAVDIWDDYARIDEPDIPLQIDETPDSTLNTMLDALNVQPLSRDIEAGNETYTYSLDGGTGQKLKVRERIIQLAASEFGYCYTKGNTTGAGELTFENRHHRVANSPVQFTLSNTMDGLVVPGSRRDVYRTVQVFVHPTNDVATASTVVIWSIQNSTTLIQSGETNTSIFGAYFDPTTHEEIGGTSTIDPVASTDYTFNSEQDGSGSDLTANFMVTASRTGLGVRWTIVNTSASQSAYITKLQVRGKPIYRFDAVLEVTVPGGYGDQVLALDMPFQNNTNVGMDVANALATRFAAPFAQVEWVRFLANRDASHMTAALTLEPGDRIALTETVSGLSSHPFIINGIRLEYTAERQLWCTWYLEAASNAQYWLLGTTGFGELGQTTTLGF